MSHSQKSEQATDPIQHLLDAWVQQGTAVTAATQRLQVALLNYEARVLEDARLRAHAAIMAVVGPGEAPKPLEALEAARKALLDAIEDYWDLTTPQDRPQLPAEPADSMGR